MAKFKLEYRKSIGDLSNDAGNEEVNGMFTLRVFK
jgi:hypothetical protein